MEKVQMIAKVCHEANRAYCCALGDVSQVAWEDVPQWQRDSCVAGVLFVMSNPDAGPSAQHDCWLEQKRVEDWKYGPIKDAQKKEHPCFMSFDELPVEQKAKDYIFGAIVRAML